MSELELSNILDGVSSFLECQVCFYVPRNIPITCCKNGHLICSRCFECINDPSKCPTCKSSMDNFNTVASNIISVIKHECKYARHGCSQKMKLKEIAEHEDKCPWKTLKCPHKKCMRELSLSNFEYEYSSHGCSSDFEVLNVEFCADKQEVVISYVIPTHLRLEDEKEVDFNLTENCEWELQKVCSEEGNFYVWFYYSYTTKRFFLAVLNSAYPSSNNFQAKVKVNPIAEGKEMLSKIIPVVPLQFLCDLQDKGDDGSTDFYIKIHEDQLLDYVNINIISCDHGIIIDITSLLVTIEIRNLDANIS